MQPSVTSPNATVMTTATLERTHKRLFSYDEMTAASKADQENARQRDALEKKVEQLELNALLRDGIEFWSELESLQELWTEAVLSGECEPDIEIDKTIYNMFRTWETATGRMVSVIDRLKHRGVELEDGNTFRECWSNARSCLSTLVEPTTPIRPITKPIGCSHEVDMSRYE